MSHLKKRGRFYHVFYWQEGTLHSLSARTTDKQAAKNFQTRLDNDLLNKKITFTKHKPSWYAFSQDYLSYAQTNKRPRSVQRDIKTFRSFNKVTGIKDFSEFNYELLERYKSIRKEQGIKESSINRELNTLLAAGKWAVKAKYAQINPTVGVKKYPETFTARDRYLSLKEIKLLLSKPISQEVRTIVRLQLWSAMRLGEALHLTWKDCDFEKGLIYFTPKNGWQPKTNQKQVIPMNSKLKAYLLTLAKTDEYVCGSKPMTEESASAVIRKVMKSLGIKDASSHTLRHTAISWAAMSGMDFPSLVRFARHTNPKQTMRYTHLLPSYSQNMVDKLPY